MQDKNLLTKINKCKNSYLGCIQDYPDKVCLRPYIRIHSPHSSLRYICGRTGYQKIMEIIFKFTRVRKNKNKSENTAKLKISSIKICPRKFYFIKFFCVSRYSFIFYWRKTNDYILEITIVYHFLFYHISKE